jgi:hypothetical protein
MKVKNLRTILDQFGDEEEIVVNVRGSYFDRFVLYPQSDINIMNIVSSIWKEQSKIEAIKRYCEFNKLELSRDNIATAKTTIEEYIKFN